MDIAQPIHTGSYGKRMKAGDTASCTFNEMVFKDDATRLKYIELHLDACKIITVNCFKGEHRSEELEQAIDKRDAIYLNQ